MIIYSIFLALNVLRVVLSSDKYINVQLQFHLTGYVFPIYMNNPDGSIEKFLTRLDYPSITDSPVLNLKGKIGQDIRIYLANGTIPEFYVIVKLIIGHKTFTNMLEWRCCTPMKLFNPLDDAKYESLGVIAKGLTNAIATSYKCDFMIQPNLYCIQYDTYLKFGHESSLERLPGPPYIYMYNGRNETLDLPIVYQIPTDAVLKLMNMPTNLKIYTENGELGVGANTPLYYLGGYGTSLGEDGEIINYELYKDGVLECSHVFKVFNCYKGCKSCTRTLATDAKHQCTECHRIYMEDPAKPGNCILPTETQELLEYIWIFEQAGINIFDPNDPFYTTRCIALPFPNEVDIPKKDRIKKFLATNDTLCSESCHYLGLDPNTHDPKCDCAKPPAKNSNATLDGVKDNFLATLFDANYDVIFCYMLVFNSIIFPKNIGSWLMIAVGLGSLGNVIYSIIKSIDTMTENLTEMCKTNKPPKGNQVNPTEKIDIKPSEVSKPKALTMNKPKPSPPPINDDINYDYNKTPTYNRNQSFNTFKQESQGNMYNGSNSNSNIPIPMGMSQLKQPVTNNIMDEPFKPQFIRPLDWRNRGRKSAMIDEVSSLHFTRQDSTKNNGSNSKRQARMSVIQESSNKMMRHSQFYKDKRQAIQEEKSGYEADAMRNFKGEQSTRRSMVTVNQNLIIGGDKRRNRKGSNLNEEVMTMTMTNLKLKENQDGLQIKKTNSESVTNQDNTEEEDNSPVDYDEMDFDIMVRRDKRNFCIIYWWYLQSVHPVLDTFIAPSPTVPRAIKISLFVLGIILDLFLTAFFYSDNYISDNYNNDDDLSNFIYTLPVSIYTYLVSSVIGVLLGILSNTERGIKKIENCQSGPEKIAQTEKFLKCYKIRLMIFNVLQIALILFFWYYIAAFCAVYPNTQDEYLGSYGISLGLSMLMPFAICAGLTGVHMIIIKCKWKWLYKVLSVLTWFY